MNCTHTTANVFIAKVVIRFINNMKGERIIKLNELSGLTISFSSHSTILFYNKDGETVFQLDPTDLSALYGAYTQMVKEDNEELRLNK